MIMIEKCPYRCRMFWYVACWETKIAYVYDTKKEAEIKTKQMNTAMPHRTYNVSWIEDSMKRHNRWSLRKVIGDFHVSYMGKKLP